MVGSNDFADGDDRTTYAFCIQHGYKNISLFESFNRAVCD